MVLVILGILLIVPAVSAETYIDESYNLDTYQTTGQKFTQTYYKCQYVTVTDVNNWNNLKTVYLHAPKSRLSNPAFLTMPSDYEDVTLYIGTDNVGNGFVGYNLFYKNDEIDSIQVWLDINEIDFTGYAGKQVIRIAADDGLLLHGGEFFDSLYETVGTDTTEVGFSGDGNHLIWGNHIARGEFYWRNDINFDGESIEITRVFDSVGYHSNFTWDYGSQVYSDISDTNQIIRIFEPVSWTLTNPNGVEYTGSTSDTGTTPSESIITVYVQSSQTGALLANAHVSISAAAGDPPTLTEVINATLPGGTATYTLQPTGTADPYPLYYRANATVPGYSQIIENHSFTLTGPHDVIIEMRPDSGGPTDPENSYLEFYVRDFSANGIPSASIQCNNQFKQTNSAGYAIFEVAKNASYPYVVKKSGYVTIEGTATVADGPRYIANIVLGPGSVPTYTPTPDPSTGETPGATPTPDRRTNEEKGQSIIDMIADNAEGIAALAIIGTLLGLLKLIAKW